MYFGVLIKLNGKSNELGIGFNSMHRLLLRQKWIIFTNSSSANKDKLFD